MNNNQNNQNNNNNTPKRPRVDIGFYLLILIVLLGAIYWFARPTTESKSIKYSDMRELFEAEQVEAFTVKDDILYLTLKDNTKLTHTLYSTAIFYEDMNALIDKQLTKGVLSEYDWLPTWEAPWWLSFLPYLIILAAFMGFWYFMMNKEMGGGKGGNSPFKFGRARTRDASKDKKKITFADVASAEEEKEELKEIVDFLKEPKRFIEMGARIPKGVLLVGPPGTGKTYLAKAVAGEAGVQFLSISGSDFVELYVGVGASRVRDLFDQAKRSAPSIVFIDEIDAVGRQRGAGLGGGHDEREQTLNQLLVEMDGFGTNEGVIVMAATNRQDILDRALLRPGRFDRIVYVGLPDIKGREEILRMHSKEKKLAQDVSMRKIAQTTTGFTPADLENLMNESALHAARNGNKMITMPDVEEAMIKVIAGPATKSKVVSDKDKKITAYHEAGHAVAMNWLEHCDPVHHISIVPHGRAAGMTISRPEEERGHLSKNEMIENIVGLLGGRVAEAIVFGDVSTGASNDLERATKIARDMVTRYGMSDKLGPVTFASDTDEVFLGRDYAQSKTYSESVATTIDEEIKRIIDEAYSRCSEILKEHYEILEMTANYLLANEVMDGEQFKYLCDNNVIPPSGSEPPADSGASDVAESSEPETDIIDGGVTV
ncbi:MAG: ATP-dependent zinc metalloprotease FtsH [Oscillospiraceae bacterium]|nr:ATP-dependent zinc metalloprotease FtsH [Oscillospiraceae bacterium]